MPRADAEQVLAAARRESENGLEHELRSAMVETGSAVCADLPQLGAELRRRRAVLAHAAREVGAQVLASGTHPTAPPDEVPVTTKERYERMATEFGRLVDEALVCGCHVHVAVPDRTAGVGVLDRIRPWLPVLLALSANSPPVAGRGDPGGRRRGRGGRRPARRRARPRAHRPRAVRPRPSADEVVDALLDHVGDALASTGDRAEVERGLDRVRREGTGAERQRAALTAGGDPALRELLALPG